MKKFGLLICVTLFVLTLRGQSHDVFYEKGFVHLKNGTVLKGRYLYSNDMEKLRLISGKNSWVFDASEVQLISSARPVRQYGDTDDFPGNVVSPPKFFVLSEAGILAGNPDNSQPAPLTLGSSLNYTFYSRLSAGVGAGIEFLKETYMPATLNLMYRLRDTRQTPFAVLQAGYHVPLEDSRTLYYNVVPEYVSSSVIWPGPWPVSQTPLQAKGGFLLHPAVGFINYSRSGVGFTMSVGYRFHRLRYSGENDYNLDVDFNRLSVKLGLIIN